MTQNIAQNTIFAETLKKLSLGEELSEERIQFSLRYALQNDLDYFELLSSENCTQKLIEEAFVYAFKIFNYTAAEVMLGFPIAVNCYARTLLSSIQNDETAEEACQLLRRAEVTSLSDGGASLIDAVSNNENLKLSALLCSVETASEKHEIIEKYVTKMLEIASEESISVICNSLPYESFTTTQLELLNQKLTSQKLRRKLRL